MSSPSSDVARATAACLPLQATIDTLWAKLAPAGLPQRTRRIGFVAPRTGDGATTIATCAAIGLARHLRAGVLLVEADSRRPSLAQRMGLPHAPGLLDVLAGEALAADAVRRTDVPGLSVLPVGGAGSVPPGAFSTAHAAEVLETLGESHDFVVFDAPPVLEAPETHALLWRLDDVCLVVRCGSSRRDDVEEAAAEIGRSGARLMGTILNRHGSDLPGWLTRAA